MALITVNINTITIQGIKDSNTYVTMGGTPSGILITNRFSLITRKSFAATRPTMIAEKTPCAPNQVAGMALTSSVVVPRGVTTRNDSSAITLAEIPSTLLSNFFTSR